MTYKIQFFILAFVAENFPKNLQIFTLGSMFFTMFGIFFDKLPKFQYFANIFYMNVSTPDQKYGEKNYSGTFDPFLF